MGADPQVTVDFPPSYVAESSSTTVIRSEEFGGSQLTVSSRMPVNLPPTAVRQAIHNSPRGSPVRPPTALTKASLQKTAATATQAAVGAAPVPAPAKTPLRKIWKNVYITLSTKDRKKVDREVTDGLTYISDKKGCLDLAGQLPVLQVIEEARTAPPPALGSVASMFQQVRAKIRTGRVSVSARDIQGNVVQPVNAHFISWSIKSMGSVHGGSEYEDLLQLRDDTYIAVNVADGVHPITLHLDDSLNANTKYTLPASADIARDLNQTLQGYGLSDKAAKEIYTPYYREPNTR